MGKSWENYEEHLEKSLENHAETYGKTMDKPEKMRDTQGKPVGTSLESIAKIVTELLDLLVDVSRLSKVN